MIDVNDLKEMLGSQGLAILQLQKALRDSAEQAKVAAGVEEQLARSEARVAELDAEVADVGTLRARIAHLEEEIARATAINATFSSAMPEPEPAQGTTRPAGLKKAAT